MGLVSQVMNEWYYSNPDPADPTQEARRMIGPGPVADHVAGSGFRHKAVVFLFGRCTLQDVRGMQPRATHTHTHTHTHTPQQIK